MAVDATRAAPGSDYSWTFEYYQSELSHEQSHIFEWSKVTGSGELDGFVISRHGAVGECEIVHLVCSMKGCGEGMLTAWLEWAKAQGIRKVFLEFHHENTRAERLYQKLGFQQIARRPRYYRNGGDAIMMSLDLD